MQAMSLKPLVITYHSRGRKWPSHGQTRMKAITKLRISSNG
jgi:hypothetical protein